MNIGLLEKIYESLSFGVFIENKDRKILYTNQIYRDLMQLGNDGNALKGMDCLFLLDISKDLFIESDKFYSDLINIPKKGIKKEEIIETVNGKYFKRKYSPITENDVLELHLWTYEEVTNEIEKQLNFLFQKDFHLKILDEIPADIAIFNTQHQYIYLNKIAVENEKTRNWLIGKDDFDYCVLKNSSITKALERRENFKTAVETKKPVQLLDEVIQKDGSVKSVLRIFHPVFDHNKKLEIVVGYGIDITKQRENEFIIKNQEERISTLMNELKEGIFQVYLNGNIVSYNNAMIKLLNLKVNETPENFKFNNIRGISRESKKQILDDFYYVSKYKENRNGIFEITNDLNETKIIEYHVWYSSTIIDGEIIIGTLSDITIQHAQETYLLKNIQTEKELNALKSKFINITSHELRTPLSVILSSAEILEFILAAPIKDSTIDAKSFLTNIIHEVLHMTDILNELMVLSQIEIGKHKFKPKLVAIHDFMASLTEGYLPFKDGRNLQIKISKNIGNIIVDSKLLKHGLTNLLNNAFKFSPNKKEPQLKVGIKKNQIVFEIEDFGIGIPEAEKVNLFQTFYRASNAENISGTGIGLVVVDYAVKEHKGTVKLNSKLNKGTLFEISVPIIKS
ncbi:MAG: PAS domain-containing sensor histidine kinase [Bacteroidia bacterium]